MTYRKQFRRALAISAALVACAACDDPARPTVDVFGATLLVDSDPQGGRIFIDGNDTGETTPALIDQLTPGARNVTVQLDTGSFTYSFTELVVVDTSGEMSVSRPLTMRCVSLNCLIAAAEFHAPAGIRFVVNGAGPLFLFDGRDAGIVWPASTSNSYAPVGMPTMTAMVGATPVALGLGNVGGTRNYWAGRPLPITSPAEPYHVILPAWITPPFGAAVTLRGVEVVQEITVDEELPDVIFVHVTWRNISADSLYRLLDDAAPVGGVTYTDAWLGFILNADVGAFGESDDDLISYDAELDLVFAYDSDFEAAGFSGGWSDQPGLIGLMAVDAPAATVRLNAWPRSREFSAGTNDLTGRVLITATQTDPPNHPDARIGYAPANEVGDYTLSVATGPVTLAPGESAAATFAVLLAAPVPGTYVSGVVQPAGDPLDTDRPLLETAQALIALAELVSSPPPAAP